MAREQPRIIGSRTPMIEKHFDVPFVAALALREKQIQQSYRPIIAVHKWFARRPGALFRGLVLSEFNGGDLSDAYYESHDLRGLTILDPFMGGGTPLIEANRLGCDVIGYDINPMAYWIVRQEIESLDLKAYRKAADDLQRTLRGLVGDLYTTTCPLCKRTDIPVKYFIWVKTQTCANCEREFDLFPGYLLARDQRHPKNVVICSQCGTLNEVTDIAAPGTCVHCGSQLAVKGPASRGRCACPHCGAVNRFPHGGQPPRHRMVAIEYHCPSCKVNHQGRFFKEPDDRDLARYALACARLDELGPLHVPDDEIPRGDETDRLRRWGYGYYRDMFNNRQLLGLELICRSILQQDDTRIRNALATNLSDLLRYQNMLCRYDVTALKSLDIFSVHGFPVGLLQVESNLLGIPEGRNNNVGSGGWSNIVSKYTKAKKYCERPFDVRLVGKRRSKVYPRGEWIGDRRPGLFPEERRVDLHASSATSAKLDAASVDAVFTDPPYFANVQYAELMDFCYVWLRKLVDDDTGAFSKASTRDEDELTGNETLGRGLEHFTEGLATVFQNMAHALKPAGPLAFTYHHNAPEGYLPLIVAILDAGLTCTAALPCPAEMGASIHINGTGSSIVDTIFVCRHRDSVDGELVASVDVGAAVQRDLALLRSGGVRPTEGDEHCIRLGHLARHAILTLQPDWDPALPTRRKLQVATDQMM